MGWTPPTEGEFNTEWFTRDEVLKEPSHRTEGYAEKRALLEELKAGLLIGVARTAQIDDKLSNFVRVPLSVWEGLSDGDEDHFWETGQIIARVGGITGYGDWKTYRYFDVRFDPQSFASHIEVGNFEAMAPPKPGPEDPTISAEEYQSWLPPARVLRSLAGRLSEADSRSEIHRRLVGGELLSVARSATWFQKEGLFEIREYGRLGSFLWLVNEVPGVDDLLWKSGTHSLSRPGWPDSEIRYSVDCFGIRFDPGSVAAMLADCDVTHVAAPSRVEEASASQRERAPSVKAARPPSDNEILAKADEMRAKGMNTYDIASRMRFESGFENVATRTVRELIKGRYNRPGRAGLDQQ